MEWVAAFGTALFVELKTEPLKISGAHDFFPSKAYSKVALLLRSKPVLHGLDQPCSSWREAGAGLDAPVAVDAGDNIQGLMGLQSVPLVVILGPLHSDVDLVLGGLDHIELRLVPVRTPPLLECRHVVPLRLRRIPPDSYPAAGNPHVGEIKCRE